jgi:5-methylcytosine-specific restriction endonuclease McrA
VGIPTRTRATVHQKYGGRCAYCGEPITQKAMQVDHIHPKYLGGSDDIENLNPSCRACNNYKLTYDIEELRRQISLQVERAFRYSVNFRLAHRYRLVECTGNPVVFHFERVMQEDSSG